MRKQYHFRPSGQGYYAWDVDRLVRLSGSLPVLSVDLQDIREIDENFWYQGKDDVPTCRSIVDHMRLISGTDLDYPIILSSDGRIMDGMHRVGKALLTGEKQIKAVRFLRDPEPDYTDVNPDELPYDLA